KVYHYPGWWEVGPQLSSYINLQKWEALSAEYKAIVTAAGAQAGAWMTAKYDAENPAAMKRLLAGGAILKPFPRDVLQAAVKGSAGIYANHSANNPMFRKLYASWRPFRGEAVSWFRVAEDSTANFMASQLKTLQTALKKA